MMGVVLDMSIWEFVAALDGWVAAQAGEDGKATDDPDDVWQSMVDRGWIN